MPLEGFEPYYEGKRIDDPSLKLLLNQITSIGVQAYGGVYLNTKQEGVGSLEIDWIAASN